MRWLARSYTWLRHHGGATRVIALLVVLAVALSFLTYLGNQTVEFPDGITGIGGERLPSPPADCIRDPALTSGAIAPPEASPGLPALNYLHTCGRGILDSEGRSVTITGLNWFGMETGTYAPDGLWTRNWQAVLDQVSSLGYNAIRFPYSNDLFHNPAAKSPAINYMVNPDLNGTSGLALLDKLIDGARQRGLKVVLDRHRPTIAGQSSLWYTDEVSEEQWIEDWVMLAKHYANNDTVIGFDLHNEPRDNATWGTGDPNTDWKMAAERAGNAILAVNPYLLIFVEGIASYENDYYWWGGHLGGVAKHPVQLQVPNRVVYSPHDYGPEVYMQGWFKDPSFPRNLPSVWTQHWGYIGRSNIAPVVVGEFGGRSVGNDPEGIWQRALLDYMHHNQIGFFNWSLNPNSGDTGGLLSDDWLNVMQDKQDVYRAYLAPAIPTGQSNRLRPPKGEVHLLYRAMNVDAKTANVAFSVQVINDGPQSLELSKVELRYWLRAGNLRGKQQVVEIDYAAVGKDHVKGEVLSSGGQTQDSYLSLTFDNGTPPVAPYQTSGEIMVRIHKSDWSLYVQADAFSFGNHTEWVRWDRLALYRDGKVVWGKEPTSSAGAASVGAGDN